MREFCKMQIIVDDQDKHLLDEIEAAQMYNICAIFAFGTFALTSSL